MAAFVDRHNRQWSLEITPYSMKRVKELTGVHLGKILADEMKPLSDLLLDPIAIVDVLYALCVPQCEQKGITDEQFGQALVGDSFESAVEALLIAIQDFFPNRQKELLAKLFSKGRQIEQALVEKAQQEIDKLDATCIVSASS